MAGWKVLALAVSLQGLIGLAGAQTLYYVHAREPIADESESNRLWGTEYITALEDLIDSKLNRRPVTRW